MSETDLPTGAADSSSKSTRENPVTVALNVLTAPGEAFKSIREQPTSFFPLALVILSTLLVTGWYFAVLDYDWYIDDTLSQFPDLSESELEEARDGMQAISPNAMMWITLFSSGASLLIIYLLQASYLSLVSALQGDEIRFRQWWSLVAWTNLPALFLAISMAVNILLNPNGQLSILELNGLTLLSLGMESGNPSLNRIFATINLAMIWNLTLLIMAHRQWLNSGVIRSTAIVLAPHLLIFGIWAYFAIN